MHTVFGITLIYICRNSQLEKDFKFCISAILFVLKKSVLVFHLANQHPVILSATLKKVNSSCSRLS
jgi:hypothetical protein